MDATQTHHEYAGAIRDPSVPARCQRMQRDRTSRLRRGARCCEKTRLYSPLVLLRKSRLPQNHREKKSAMHAARSPSARRAWAPDAALGPGHRGGEAPPHGVLASYIYIYIYIYICHTYISYIYIYIYIYLSIVIFISFCCLSTACRRPVFAPRSCLQKDPSEISAAEFLRDALHSPGMPPPRKKV